MFQYQQIQLALSGLFYIWTALSAPKGSCIGIATIISCFYLVIVLKDYLCMVRLFCKNCDFTGFKCDLEDVTVYKHRHLTFCAHFNNKGQKAI